MDVDRIKTYSPADYPNIKGGEATYLTIELGKLKSTVKTIVEVMTALEARIVALEP